MNPISLTILIATTMGPRTTVTVTADRVSPAEVRETAKLSVVHDRAAMSERPMTTIGEVFRSDPGILVQSTTTAQVSPFLRGLTGYQVLNLVDGVRYNNSTFRSGPNQYLALLEPSQARSIEAVLGPAAAEFGSDAMGGVIQVLTPATRFGDSASRWEFHGNVDASFGSADLSGTGSAQLQLFNRRFSALAGGSGARFQDLRAGGGDDSRHTLRRLFGLNQAQIEPITGNRQQDSGFGQAGFHTKMAFRPTDSAQVSGWYQRSEQMGVRNYKDLWGGLGRLQSGFGPQSTDLLYVRGEKTDWGWLDSLAGTVSWNRQRDGSTRQNLRTSDAVTVDEVIVDAIGFTGQARAAVGNWQAIAFGGEWYGETIGASRLVNRAVSRPLYPDGSKYRTAALFAQDSVELFARRLRLTGGLRWSDIRYETIANRFGTIDAVQNFRDWTYNFSATFRVTRRWGLQFTTGRGFRAPNANDLGAIGLNDLGFEVPSAEAAAAGALLSTNAGEGALSQGRALAALSPERLFNYEGGFRFQAGRFYARAQVFWADLRDPIVRRTLLFPVNAVPATVAGLPVTVIRPTPQQAAQGVVTVAGPADPRALKAFVNDGRSRYYGVESLAEYKDFRWQIQASYSYIVGRDLNPNRNIRRLPPQQGSLRVRRQTSWRGMWLEGGLTAMGAQTRLSGGDFDDERIGGSRSRNDIAAFFSGARIAPFIEGGRFTPTGETLLQIQNRVLPGVGDTVRVPLYRSTAGWAAVDAKAAMPLNDRLLLTVGLFNLLDKNYRVHGSGTDAPGVNAFVSVRYSF